MYVCLYVRCYVCLSFTLCVLRVNLLNSVCLSVCLGCDFFGGFVRLLLGGSLGNPNYYFKKGVRCLGLFIATRTHTKGIAI